MYLKQPTREQRGPRIMFPYLVLLRVGFTLPQLLPVARCALTAPFHPYLTRQAVTGGIFSAALSVGSHPPGVTWHSVLWSPDFPPQTIKDCLARLPGQLPQQFYTITDKAKYITPLCPKKYFCSDK